MTGSSTLELGVSLNCSPAAGVEGTNVTIQSFSQKRASRDCPVRSVGFSVLTMTLPENTSPDCVKLFKGGGVDFLDDGVEEEMEVLESFKASINEVGGSYGEKIVYICLERVEELSGGFRRDWWNFVSTPGNFQDILVVEQRFSERGRGVKRRHVWRLEGGKRVKESIRYFTSSI